MNYWVGIKEKKSFLQWFLKNHRLKRSDAKYLLDYLLVNSHILENVHFTDEIRKNEKTIVISSVNSDEIGFIYYDKNHKTDDVSKAVKEVLYRPSDTIFLLLHFHGKMMNQNYINLIGNPALESVRRYKKYEEYSKIANELFDQSLEENKEQRLRVRIDQALDNKDAELFKRLSEELKELLESKK